MGPDPHHWITDQDQDPALFSSGFQEAKKLILYKKQKAFKKDFSYPSSKISSYFESQSCKNRDFS